MRALLKAGADIAQATADGKTALMAASKAGHLKCMNALLEAGANVAQAAADGSTALMRASQEGQLECVRRLLEAGADVMQLHGDGHTCALELGCASLETLQLLCAYAPFRQAVHAHPMPADDVSPDGATESARFLGRTYAQSPAIDRRTRCASCC